MFLHSFLSGVDNYFNLYLYLFLSLFFGTQVYLAAILGIWVLLEDLPIISVVVMVSGKNFSGSFKISIFFVFFCLLE